VKNKNMISPLRKSGFSLIEVIISINIAVILFLIITSVYSISQHTYKKTDTIAEITQNGRVIIDRLIRELRQTDDIVTTIPVDNSDPGNLPSEIMFQDGHDTSIISYIRYYMDGSNINRQIIRYYFAIDTNVYVRWYDTDQIGDPPITSIVEDKIIGEYAYDLEFWGDSLININLYLLKGSDSTTINTSIYGRNL
jgi:prepilin-type N-terminal cleavage/methylation domain-containing protein